VAGCLNDTIWKNKHLSVDTRRRIYKSEVRPMMTCTDERRPERTMTQRILETAEIKIFRKITNKTLRDRARREDIRNTCKVDNLNEWV
jgi:hypothetical protein